MRYIHLSGRELSEKLNRAMAGVHAQRIAMLAASPVVVGQAQQ